MARSNAAGERARARLLDAAERLIATQGPSVPLRQIVLAAGQRNNSAVAYHFGSREGLLEAVWDRRTEIVNRERAQMLEKIHERGRADDLYALMQAHVLPMAHEIGANLPSYWARFNEVTLAGMPLVFIDAFDADLASYVDREVPLRTLSYLLHLMRKSVAGGAEPAAGLHVALMVRSVVGALASWERDQERGLIASSSLLPFADGLVEMGTTMLSQPSAGIADAMGLLSS